MGGDLNMGGNDITTNIGNVDGVKVSAHAARHGANSTDPLPNAIALTLSSATGAPAIGTSNSFSRADHVHDLTIDHVHLSNIGSNTHATIDTHLASTSNPHGVDIADVTPLTTKGDLVARNATITTRLAVGANNTVLQADSVQATGIKWTAPGSGGIGNIIGPGTVVDNRLVLFNGTTGNLLKQSTVITDAAGILGGVASITLTQNLDGNTWYGYTSLDSVTAGMGLRNSAFGENALTALTTGDNNTAVGHSSLSVCTEGSANIGLGRDTLAALTTGSDTIGIGFLALSSDVSTVGNIAIGTRALRLNVSGNNLVAVGYQALTLNTGDSNTAIGREALLSNTTGSINTALGHSAGNSLTTGNNNICIGFEAGSDLATNDNRECWCGRR